MGYGTIFQMEVNATSMMNSNPINFTAVPFYESANLSFSAGFALDTERNVLFVCRADPATFGDGLGQSPPPDNWTRYMSGIHIVDMDTKTVIDDYDLQDYNVDNDDPMYHLCNDIAIDSKGNAYVTDSFGGAIYKLTLNNGGSYELSIFSYKLEWQEPGYIFFDGLSIDPVNEEFLLVNAWINSDTSIYPSPFFSGDSVMIKIPMDTPMQPYRVNYTKVKTLDRGFDGQVMSSDGMYLYVTGDMTSSVYQFTSEDNWDSMTLNQVQTTQYETPTAIAFATSGPYGTGIADSVFVSSAFFLANTSVEAYPIELLDFTTGPEYLFPNGTCGGVINEEKPIFYIEETNLLPETMRYYDDYGFMTGSMAYGSIFQMVPSSTSTMTGNPLNFTVEEFYSNDILNFSAGFAIDTERDILFICHANSNTFNDGLGQNPSPDSWPYGFMGGVMIVDLSTGEMIANFDLQDYNVDDSNPMYHLANDIIIDSTGNAYVTDSFGGAIYKIAYDSNNSTMPYSMEIFSYTSDWQVPGYIFFDGLSMDPVNEEFILVNGWVNSDVSTYSSPFFSGQSVMIKIPMDTPMQPYMCDYTNVVSLDRGFDGQIFSDDGMYLYVTGDMSSAVYRFVSEDNWDSLTLEQVKTTQNIEPTAIAFATNGPYGTGVEESVYVSSAFFTANTSVAAYPIELMDFSNSDSIIIEAIEVEVPVNSYSLDDEIFYMNKDYLLPETMRYYAQNDLGFLTGSMGYGTIFQMVPSSTSSSETGNPLNFTAEPFFNNSDLVFSAGFEIDFTRNVLFICHADPKTFSYGLSQNKTTNWTGRYMGGVMIVNLTTQDVIANFDFQDYNVDDSNPMYHLANDIIVDESDGSAYVTDSFGGAIYKISYDGSASSPYSVSIFSYISKWQVPGYIFFDGLSMDPLYSEFILVNAWINTDTSMYSSPFFSGTSVMIKIPMDTPMQPYRCNFTNVVSLDRGFDGQIFSDDGMYLYVTGDRSQSVYRFTSEDNWDSLTLESVRMTQYDEPTAIAFAKDGPYGTGLDQVVYVSSAFFTHPESYYPIELIDFRRSTTTNNTIMVNNTETIYVFPNGTCGDVIDKEKPVLYIEETNLLPETMRYYDDYGFMTGSMAYGSIFQMVPSSVSNMTGNPLNFTAQAFYSNDILNFSAGFAIDTERDILFICHANSNTFKDGLGQDPSPDNWTYGFMGGVMIVDLSTGEMIDNFDLQDYNVDEDNPMYHLANDIIIDSSGNAYVTDSFGGAIYKIAYENATYSMEIFSYTSDWQVPGYIFFDGLSMDPVNEEFILVNGWVNSDVSTYSSPFFSGNSVMIKIPMDTPMKPYMCNYANVAGFDRGFDGQIFSDDGMYLYVTGDMSSAVHRFISEDNWDSLILEQTKITQNIEPTAIAFATNGPYGTGVEESVYVSSAFFTANTSVAAYPIELMDFSNSNSISVIVINNNNTNNSSNSGDSSSGSNAGDTISKDVFYALIGVISALGVLIIILVVCLFRMRNANPSMSTNIDYHKM